MLDGIVNLERVHGAKVKKGVSGSTRDFNWHRGVGQPVTALHDIG
jgi:hypothetical protein